MALTPDEHAAEVERQEEIAADLAAAEAEVTVETPDSLEATVKLRSKNVETYPLYVSVPDYPEIVFESASATVTVPAPIAEHVTYLDNVEVTE